MKYQKPRKLSPGDTVAIVSPSWAGPSIFPHVYEHGLKVLEEWGLVIKEYLTARGNKDQNTPEARAKDINDAFADPEVKAIFASIGGEDSVRILPFLDKKIIANNPKILMGYSDTTTLLTFINQLGIVTFNGPSIMAGFSQMKSLPESFKKHVHAMLFSPMDSYQYVPYSQYCEGYLDWKDEKNLGKTKEPKPTTGWKMLQGTGLTEGELFGGCIDVLEFMKGTDFWPASDFWNGKILFLETSEEKPSVDNVRWMLRNYGMQGVFDRISAVLFARPRDYSNEEKETFEKMIQDVIGEEFGKVDLPVMANLDFGHTDPQIVLPLGVKAKLDCDSVTLELTEAWLK